MREADEQCLARMATVGPDMPLWEVIALLETLGVDQIAVAEGGHLLGVVNRSRALNAL